LKKLIIPAARAGLCPWCPIFRVLPAVYFQVLIPVKPGKYFFSQQDIEKLVFE
jgi:hypothetical protein